VTRNRLAWGGWTWNRMGRAARTILGAPVGIIALIWALFK
jgi:hypothetical protein